MELIEVMFAGASRGNSFGAVEAPIHVIRFPSRVASPHTAEEYKVKEIFHFPPIMSRGNQSTPLANLRASFTPMLCEQHANVDLYLIWIMM